MKRLSCALVVAVLGATLITTSAQAQPGRQGPRRGPGMMGRGLADPLMLLRLEQVQKELELVDEQKAELQKIGQQMGDEIRKMFSGMQDLTREERLEKMRELREKLQEKAEEFRKKAYDELLPHQKKRLREIRVQMLGSGALSDKEVIEALGITKDQQKKLTAIGEEVSNKVREMFRGLENLSREERRTKFRELREEMGKAREEGQKKALQVLTPPQRKKLEQLKGEKFELDRSQVFGGRRGGGQPGGERPGGERPGGGRPGGR